MKEISVEIGKRLTELRKQHNKTQQEVADDLPGLTIQMISSYENGKQSPAIENIIKISNYYNISIDYLLTGKKSTETLKMISTYEDVIRHIILLVNSHTFRINTYTMGDTFDKNKIYCFNLDSNNKVLYDFQVKFNKLNDAKEIMGEEMYKIALEGLISKYKEIPIKVK